VCIKLHNVVSVSNYEATKACRQNNNKDLSVRLRCLLLLTLRSMQQLVKRRATLSTDMEEMKSKNDSCLKSWLQTDRCCCAEACKRSPMDSGDNGILGSPVC
jgi:hypothetical protein